MNIFYLDPDPIICAKYHCDKHIVKMCIEYAQILSTAHRVLDGYQLLERTESGRKRTSWKLHDDLESKLYKSTHINHPCCKWVRESKSNYIYLYDLFVACTKEYTKRYNKIHKSSELITPLTLFPFNIPENINFTDPPKCMPEYCMKDSTVDSYRNFYLTEKYKFLTWKTDTPDWIKDISNAY